ncbi:unnamed protein product [Closterium sp. Naga37s-1]|nr:unnamed protein product [Closterium sp. Naga37s-1]
MNAPLFSLPLTPRSLRPSLIVPSTLYFMHSSPLSSLPPLSHPFLSSLIMSPIILLSPPVPLSPYVFRSPPPVLLSPPCPPFSLLFSLMSPLLSLISPLQPLVPFPPSPRFPLFFPVALDFSPCVPSFHPLLHLFPFLLPHLFSPIASHMPSRLFPAGFSAPCPLPFLPRRALLPRPQTPWQHRQACNPKRGNGGE